MILAAQMEFVWPTSYIGMMHPAAGKNAARGRAKDFFEFASAATSHVSYNEAKGRLACSSNQAETRKSLFEELGLLYVPYASDRIILTPVGKQLFDLMNSSTTPMDTKAARRADALLVWALSNCQINRPQSFGSPRISDDDRKTCDIRPYALVWSIIPRLNGELRLHEFMGVLRKIPSVDDLDNCVTHILAARATGKPFLKREQLEGRNELMNDRIYWSSHISVAGRALSYDSESQIFTFNPQAEDLIAATLMHQGGCSAAAASGIRSRPWTSTEQYFEEIGGRACPPFISSGRVKIVEIAGEKLVLLGGYKLEQGGSGLHVRGGPELCSLPLLSACFHPGMPKRLLRLDAKRELPDGQVEISCGLGRPITNASELLKLTPETEQ